MKNLDYKSLRLLDLVIKEQGFEKASAKLFVSQSAVSQRIKQLENQIGEILLTRTVPPKPTEYGQKLLGLLYHVTLLEHDSFSKSGNEVITIPIAVNADSIATWLFPTIKTFLNDYSVRLDIKLDDETKTLSHLLKGEVVGAVSLQPLPIIGGKCDYIGALDYIFVSSKSFAEKYFKNGVTQDALLKAPIVSFNKETDTHHDFLQQYFSLTPGSLNSHIVPSSEAYIQLVLQDSACCMIPRQQIKDKLDSGEIINLVPSLSQQKKLYWHRYQPESDTMKRLSTVIIENIKKYLV
ncbi:LysR family transcriptional regulator ArgP [Morganella morganii]|uniref:LysR family transcriptional regulator ArgP n=1 Tax=Morganella morganii TaxID=582 RepID=UPI000D1E0A45|nr:LysR family transcriptional regulator ArgP [Morganella morganii]HAE78338.1 ArgP/LysG family DNA-binding transcriptional regulator [Morganella sp. (in: enterobacteria)]QXO43469.1 LysR family transcriptional regulator ArgP [Morganella morganii]QXO47061.1 LysR family transcriptional regulator ArgP [Morganella morganii]QXO50830.1 LysR family transcriptional regulator ArgP [Morganella morganii]QXO54696.1 LysR family transcriptional regulator ArgP [Morganella morganii]